MTGKITPIGEINGASIRAITDALGPQVVIITDGKTYISPKQESHEKAIDLGKSVMNGHTPYLCWDGPVNDFLSIVCALHNPYEEKEFEVYGTE